MPLYQLNEQGVASLSHRPLPNEKHLQTLVEKYLPELLGIWCLATEYPTTTGGRMDTFGVDKNGSPVIIEYKKRQNDNIINQALSYRKWLSEQKSEFFEMLVRKRLPDELSKDIQVNWKKPRIICIAESFNRFDLDTVDVLSPLLAIELMVFREYEYNIFSLETVRALNSKFEPASTKNDQIVNGPADDEAESLLEYHRLKGSPDIQKLFEELRNRILSMGTDVVERAVKGYVGYRASKNFAEVHVQKSALALSMRGIVNDPQSRVKKAPDSHGWSLNQQVTFSSFADLDYIIDLVEQSYADIS